MKQKYSLIRLCFLFSLVAGLIAAAPASHASAESSGGWVYLVPTTVDEPSDGECTVDCTLREAIALADNGDTISITATGIINMQAALPGYSISKSITINGPGSSNLTIDAGFNHRIFYIFESAADGVSMSGLTLTGGNTSGEGGVHYGGAIASLASLTLNDMNIDHNTSWTSDGGGIYMNGALQPSLPTLTIKNSVLTNNSGSSGGNLFIADADLDMSATTISAGSAAYGAGIYIDPFGSTSPDLSILGSRITGNTSTLGGGGISMSEKTRLFIYYSSIDNNEAAEFGGGIDYYSSETTSLLQIFNSTVGENRLTANGTPGTPDSNSGAGIYMRGNVNIINSTIAYNDGDGGNGAGTNSYGGGIYAVSLGGATQNLYNSIIANNLADSGPAVEGTITSGGYNLVEEGATGFANFVNNDIIGSDPLLDPLEVNLLGTADYPLTALSPALNTIPTSNSYCIPGSIVAIDQRRVQRPQNSFCEMGSYELDNTAPSTTSITRRDANPTDATSVYFQPVFSETIAGLDVSDFALVTTGSISGASITEITNVGEVVVNTGTGDGTIKIIIPNTATLTDYAGLSMTGLPFTSGEAYTIDKTAPTVSSITRASASPASGSSVDFTVTFSETVTGVDGSDFSLTTTGLGGSPAVTNVSGAGSVYTVTASTGTGNGSLRLNIPNTATIIDQVAHPVSGLPFNSGQIYSIVRNQTFQDVPTSYWAWQYIERLYIAGITGGCTTSPLNYCPTSAVTRAQMAIFLEKGMHGSSFSPPNVAATFTDTSGHWAEDWIEALKNDGITSGCGAGIYCPEDAVTRAQMAIFLLKAKHGSSYTPPAATGVFTDVATTYWAAAWIEQLAAEGVTSGCGAGIYCPDNPVTRDQMAVFLVKAFGLP